MQPSWRFFLAASKYFIFLPLRRFSFDGFITAAHKYFLALSLLVIDFFKWWADEQVFSTQQCEIPLNVASSWLTLILKSFQWNLFSVWLGLYEFMPFIVNNSLIKIVGWWAAILLMFLQMSVNQTRHSLAPLLDLPLPENIGRLFETVLDETLQFYWGPRHHMFLLFSLHWHWGHWNTNYFISQLNSTNWSHSYRQPSVWRLDWSWDWWTLDIQTFPHHWRWWI